ncbi:YqcC family protein [Salinisphaera aquimarina]|uniref:YqcC family protein n=1 Tax=Salinisphaera aquimarina TaxID=2094031 RepID=A0ABV7ELX0_9GAMM
MQRLHEAADIVLGIEQAMRDADFWHDHVPTPAAMASRTPFCADTLAFSEWLQFVFLPRIRALIEDNGALPTASAIAPLAEEALEERLGKSELVAHLQRFDALIGGNPRV